MKLSELSSAPATERKRKFVGDSSDDALCPPDGTTFMIVDLGAMNTSLTFAKCKICNGALEIVRDKQEYVKMGFMCANCGANASVWNSPHIHSGEQMNPFNVNILATRVMQPTGNRQTAFNGISSLMGICRRALNVKTRQSYVKMKLTPAADRAARNLTSDCAPSVHELYAELNMCPTGNIAVSCDGSWTTRGHTSHIDVGTVLELFNGLVLDCCIEQFLCWVQVRA